MEAGEEDSALGVRGQEADRALHCLELPVSTLHQNDMDSACCFPLAEQDRTGDVILFRFLLLVLLPRTLQQFNTSSETEMHAEQSLFYKAL